MSQHPTEHRVAVLVCIAEPILRVGVCTSIASEPDMDVVDADPKSALPAVEVIVADTSTATQIAKEGVQRGRILVIAAHAREHLVRSALKRGVHGFVLLNSAVGELLAAIRTLSHGGSYLCAPARQQLAQVAERDMLTSRENEVLHLLARGLCNKSIARDLDIAVGTVKVHVKSIMSKLDASCRTEAASIATGRGLVDVLDASARRLRPHPLATAWVVSSTPETRCA